ncbi:hypothetical protein [Bordetella avium]|uniref:Membrane protein n=1 Tax=Bordetella avium (strain 197N) TaxID=360910 RepID=Q2L2L4_BORA1|nr:hypothetical protein [Bordetella avium]AZY48808.1 hypothetical protein C0J09_06380 [Bordetella avium]AZY52185.1 hypothetical protein C0J07_06435 [Bordetella avium]RIQ14113.1 hypothetical protein D0432_07585 [Bordetella avium]RIQ17986.1 hypothetical protein D0850_07515 [Bordetella avium]RIQ36461.1 hypothetical protein D0849_01995 [Bordetella avium]
MSIPGEPKNGDFARYVEELSRSAPAAAGTRLPTEPANTAVAQAPGEVPSRRAKPKLNISPAAETQAPTMAEQARYRQTSSTLRMLGFVAICLAVWNFASFAAGEHDNVIRILIPGLIGFWLFRRAARALALSRQPARNLPPLNLPPKP